MSADRTTIGVTPDNEQVLVDVMSRKLFHDQMDAAKFALSLAVKAGIQPSDATGTDTKWNVGSFDKNGDMRILIPVLFPGTDAPYRAAESLVNAGLALIGRHLAETGDLDILKLVGEGDASFPQA
jgi:hypothetical protein